MEFIGGVPELLVPDNPRALVARPDRYEPELSRTAEDFVHHYGTAMLPARPRKPQDKSKVEVGVLIVERWILARLRNHRFYSLAQLNKSIKKLVAEPANAMTLQRQDTRNRSPLRFAWPTVLVEVSVRRLWPARPPAPLTPCG